MQLSFTHLLIAHRTPALSLQYPHELLARARKVAARALPPVLQQHTLACEGVGLCLSRSWHELNSSSFTQGTLKSGTQGQPCCRQQRAYIACKAKGRMPRAECMMLWQLKHCSSVSRPAKLQAAKRTMCPMLQRKRPIRKGLIASIAELNGTHWKMRAQRCSARDQAAKLTVLPRCCRP
eukprot:1161782-Pelagomonas_calceolata.AAC.7